MSSRDLGVISLQRFLAVERYRETHPTASSTHPLRSPGAARTGGHADTPNSRTGSRAPAQAHQG